MASKEHMEFPRKVRELRRAHRLRHSEVAEAVGIKSTTSCNMECNNFKTIRIDRVHRLAKLYRLDDAATARLVADWEALPESEYNRDQAPVRERRRIVRAKARRHDLLEISLIEVLARWLGDQPDGPCCCPDLDPFAEPAPPCELCTALALFGLRWTTFDEVIGQLDDIRAKVAP